MKTAKRLYRIAAVNAFHCTKRNNIHAHLDLSRTYTPAPDHRTGTFDLQPCDLSLACTYRLAQRRPLGRNSAPGRSWPWPISSVLLYSGAVDHQPTCAAARVNYAGVLVVPPLAARARRTLYLVCHRPALCRAH